MFLPPIYNLSNPQVTCVINNFQQVKRSPPPMRHQRPESMLGMPMVALPCVESPLEKLSGTQVRGGGRWEAGLFTQGGNSHLSLCSWPSGPPKYPFLHTSALAWPPPYPRTPTPTCCTPWTTPCCYLTEGFLSLKWLSPSVINNTEQFEAKVGGPSLSPKYDYHCIHPLHCSLRLHLLHLNPHNVAAWEWTLKMESWFLCQKTVSIFFLLLLLAVLFRQSQE